MSQIILAQHEYSTNWGDCKSNKLINQIKCWFLRRGEYRSTRRKTSRSRVENQQRSGAEGDLVLMQTSLLFSRKSCCCYAN